LSTETLSDILPARVEAVAERLLRRACAADVRIATAESCTGGLLAALLTDVEGASHAFERGFVVYSPDAKCELLGVAHADIARCGAVSRDVAVAMADGALRAAKADVALAITGFAGPGAPGDEAGLVHFGCARTGRPTAHREAHFGDIGRGPTRLACLQVALEMLDAAI
jgi:nicotinamide-nucleotide amidase